MDILPPKKVKLIDIPGKGRGVVATEAIRAGEVIEVCPILILRPKDAAFLENGSDTLHYYFLEQTIFNRSCVMFGYASMYNHSFEPNADLDYDDNPAEQYVLIRALKSIEPGEEIVWNYDDTSKVQKFMPVDVGGQEIVMSDE